jgi:hypothetical protein
VSGRLISSRTAGIRTGLSEDILDRQGEAKDTRRAGRSGELGLGCQPLESVRVTTRLAPLAGNPQGASTLLASAVSSRSARALLASS